MIFKECEMRSILVLFFLTSIAAMAQEPDSTSALFGLLNAERSFAQSSAMHGRKASFVENFADESVVFTNKWITNGKQFTKAQKESPRILKWEPEFMDIANSRDFGISTGPWEMQDYLPGTVPLATGYFLTVWKKQPNGVWQVILDAGSETPAPEVNNHTISFPAGADKPFNNKVHINTVIVSAELSDRDRQMLDIWKRNPVSSTYAAFLTTDVRIQKSSELPKIKKDLVRLFLDKLNRTLTWTTVGSGVASSGDLGFTYGTFETNDVSEISSGHYVRIWKKQSDGKWLISLEMINTGKLNSGSGD
jgi:ketosteroid isomerase-like protein